MPPAPPRHAAEKRRNQTYWRTMASQFDGWSRSFLPPAYFFALALVFSLELSDDYESDRTATMFSYWGHVTIPNSALIGLSLYVAAAAACIWAFVLMRRIAAKKAHRAHHGHTPRRAHCRTHGVHIPPPIPSSRPKTPPHLRSI